MSLEKMDHESPEMWPEKSECEHSIAVSVIYFLIWFVVIFFSLTQVPGITEFAALNSITDRDDGVPSWTRGLSQEDINAMHRKWSEKLQMGLGHHSFNMRYVFSAELGALSHAGLIAEIKKLYDQAYQLGIEEAREMTRGKYLNIFTPSNRKK